MQTLTLVDIIGYSRAVLSTAEPFDPHTQYMNRYRDVAVYSPDPNTYYPYPLYEGPANKAGDYLPAGTYEFHWMDREG